MPIHTHPVPSDIRQPRMRLEVREVGGVWGDVEVAFATSIDETPHSHGGAEGWVALTADEPVECRLSVRDPIGTAVVRPSMRESVNVTIDGRSVTLTVPSPRHLVVQLNYRPLHIDYRWSGAYTLYLFVEPPDPTLAEARDNAAVQLAPGHHTTDAFDQPEGVTILVEPGVHTVEGERVLLKSRQTLHLADGAYLRSHVHAIDADAVTLRGRGVLDGTGLALRPGHWNDPGDQGFVFFERGTDHVIDGVTLFDSPYWNVVSFGTHGMRVRNFKCIGWRVNNDGLQPRSCSDYVAERCFLKCADDCVAIKTRRAAADESRALHFRQLICWNDRPGNALEIGHSSQSDLLEDVVFEHVDVVHADNSGNDATLSIHLVDGCVVRRVTYRDIRVEGKNDRPDLWFRIDTTRYTIGDLRGKIERVVVDGYHSERDVFSGTLHGHDDAHGIVGVTLSNVTAAGKPVTSWEPDLKFARDVRFGHGVV